MFQEKKLNWLQFPEELRPNPTISSTSGVLLDVVYLTACGLRCEFQDTLQRRKDARDFCHS